VFLSVADLDHRQQAYGRDLKHLEDYQERYAKDPTDWLAVQGRIAKLHQRLGHVTLERKAHAQALAYWKAHKDKVGERGMEVVAQAQYLEVEPDFAKYDKIDFAVPPRLSQKRQVTWLKSQLEFKGKKLLELQRDYTAVVNTKQAEPAVCALYKIGLGYKHFAHALQKAPLPPEIRHDRALAEEYRSQLRQAAEAPEKKSVEALEYAMSKSRELGVSNACSKAATEILVSYKPDQYGATLERLPELPAARAVRSRSGGNGLQTALYHPAPRGGSKSDEAFELPPLGAPGKAAGPAARAGPAAGQPDADRAIEQLGDEPAPRPSPPAASKDKDKDEDLLP